MFWFTVTKTCQYISGCLSSLWYHVDIDETVGMLILADNSTKDINQIINSNSYIRCNRLLNIVSVCCRFSTLGKLALVCDSVQQRNITNTSTANHLPHENQTILWRKAVTGFYIKVIRTKCSGLLTIWNSRLR